jgi:hypothetical protein
MVVIAKLALYTWVPFVLLVFSVMTPRRAVIFAYIAGWLFLPMLKIKFRGIPDLDKVTASSFGVLLGAVLFDARTLLAIRPKWFDLPMLCWCLCPFVTSMVQKVGAYDGFSNVVSQLGVWGIPYFIGRCYFKDLEAYKELGIGIVIGALCYMPFAWLEMWISPQLHKKIYGFFQHSFDQTKRWGSYRPMVFMQSGLALAMYMTVAAVVGIWMWLSGTVKKIWGMPMSLLMGVLFVTAILCKTMAALGFLFMAGAALLWIKWLRKSPGVVAGLPILIMLAIPPTYMYLRATDTVNREEIISFFSGFTPADRLQSLDVRIKAEDRVTEHALTPEGIGERDRITNVNTHNPLWGWGKWDPANPRETPWRIYIHWNKVSPDGIPYEVSRDEAPTDGLWIITLGQFGIVGVTLLTITILLPALILWRRVPLPYWHHPIVAPAAAMALLLITHMIDNLLNGMVNPIFMLALGGISAIGPAIRPIHRRYGTMAGAAVLDQLQASSLASGRGFPVQPAGYPAYGQPGYGYPAGVAAQAGFPQQQPMAPPADAGGVMGGFPVIPGLQAGSIPFGTPGQQRRRK